MLEDTVHSLQTQVLGLLRDPFNGGKDGGSGGSGGGSRGLVYFSMQEMWKWRRMQSWVCVLALLIVNRKSEWGWMRRGKLTILLQAIMPNAPGVADASCPQ